MRSIILVSYDIVEDKRRNKIFKKLKGYGEALQYSLFHCILTPSERLRMRSDLWPLIDHRADRLVLIDLGPEDGRGRHAIESWGQPLQDSAGHDVILII